MGKEVEPFWRGLRRFGGFILESACVALLVYLVLPVIFPLGSIGFYEPFCTGHSTEQQE